MPYNKQDALKQLGKVNWQNYREAVEKIVQIAREITEAEVGVLFLTADGMFLEAAHWKRELPPQPPASELPTYRLHWWEEDDKKLDGITAYVAVRRKTVNLNQGEVFEHPAWKGKWDAVFLEGVRTRCTGILAVPVQSTIGAKPGESRVHGVLKVENPKDRTPFNRFKDEHRTALEELAKAVATVLDTSLDFWRDFTHERADLKVSYIVELLERGQPIGYNLSQALGYTTRLFQTWLGCKGAVHVFWSSGKIPKAHVLYPWDFAAGDHPLQHVTFQEDLTGELEIINRGSKLHFSLVSSVQIPLMELDKSAVTEVVHKRC